MVRTHYPGQTKTQVYEKLKKAREQKNSSVVDKYMANLDTYEAQKNDTKNAKRRRRSATGNDNSNDDSSSSGHEPDTEVSAMSVSGLEMKRYVGIFWPVNVWKKENKPELPKSDLTKLPYMGKKVPGYMRDQSDGWAPGCIEVCHKNAHVANKKTTLHNSRNSLYAGETEEFFQAAASQVNVSSSKKANKDGTESLVVSFPKLQGRKSTADDSEDDLWGDIVNIGAAKSAAAAADGEEAEHGWVGWGHETALM